MLFLHRLGDCNGLYVGMHLEMKQKLQLVQNTAACMLMGASKFQHVTPILLDLHWFPFIFCAQFKVLLTFKWLETRIYEEAFPSTPLFPCTLFCWCGEALLHVPPVGEIR